MKPEYIFIVGLPRTGTKLMMNILTNIQEGDCQVALENFYLGRFLRPGVRQRLKKFGDLSVDANVYKLVDAMYTGKFFGAYWQALANGELGIDRETLTQQILASDRTEKAIYITLLRLAGSQSNEAIYGDKTGPHLYHVTTLLEWFPQAKIIHTFRDPRAVLASEHKKLLRQRDYKIDKAIENGNTLRSVFLRMTRPLFSLVIVAYITMAWIYAARLHYKYKNLYPDNYYLSKFEDLVDNPDESVKDLCAFIGVEFHPSMLNPPQIGSSYDRTGRAGFDTQTLSRWQSYLKPWMSAWLIFWSRGYLRKFGYLH